MGRPPYVADLREHIGNWTPICGMTDPGEEPDTTAVREALEEARVHIEVERLVSVQSLAVSTYPNGDRVQYLDHAFRCRWVAGEAAVGDDESTEVSWFPLDALPELQPRFLRHLQLVLDAAPGVVFGVEQRPA